MTRPIAHRFGPYSGRLKAIAALSVTLHPKRDDLKVSAPHALLVAIEAAAT